MRPSLVTKGDIHTFLKEYDSAGLVRLLTCGSVDDGKSTLIGRLFLDAAVLPGDTLAALEEDSKHHGTQNGALDPALLTDGLKAEREQGITIDVAYRFFSTRERSFIIADAPGHEQYTRNMVTAASTADMAIILLDARHGVREQSKRHAFIASLLGIKHAIVVINKMDLVEFSEDVYRKIKADFLAFAGRLEITDLHFVPLSALLGDNVVEQSAEMPWYSGGTLLHLLNTVHIASDRNMIDFRFPVQYVNRPNPSYRGYCGTIASGSVRPGDAVVVLPSHQVTRISAVDTFDGELDRAFTPMSVALRLEDNVDVSRGDMIVPVNNVPEQRTDFDAMIVSMHAGSMNLGQEYLIKHTTKTTTARIQGIRYVMDINTLSRQDRSELRCNDIARCALSVAEPLASDSYARNRTTGSFILIDPHTNHTVAVGMILDRKAEEVLESGESSSGVHFPILWLTGNTGAGKSTLAEAAERHFNRSSPAWNAAARRVIVLDGDEMRETVSTEDDLSPEGRRKHNIRVARLAKLMQSKGFLVIVSVIAPYDTVRKEISEICDPLWVYVKRSGREAHDRPYEVPQNPDYIIDHDKLDPNTAAHALIDFIVSRL
ncbi:sulfate adenylyltransferase subunit CysN [Candidatus Peregrinibacteria bacterium]|nr:sulfate adenylyltransferase subunit CysN [Candidatus Peregrinibacteria bacterium]